MKEALSVSVTDTVKVRPLVSQHVHVKVSNAAPAALQLVKPTPPFDMTTFLRSAEVDAVSTTYQCSDVIFAQGDAADSVMYIREGVVKLSVLSHRGQEGVVALLESGDFFGESALAAHHSRLQGATAATATTVLIIPKEQMIRLLHANHAFSDRFITHTLARNIRLEGDLVDQLLNSSEKRLARALLLLAHYGKSGKTHRALPRVSQTTLAEMVGTTRSRINFFMNRFKSRGFIEDNGGLKINDSLLTVLSRVETAEAVQRSGGYRDAASRAPQAWQHRAYARARVPVQ